ncbi:hypothetical protein [Limnoglobus roseus]|uniref:Uncharacterized protein n=1 Tax=Limnoglobus roseus TaxID=2598579 RepID=A0A5C1AI55_9BACT|nr:hypothetical protein [Limnoglobus roseus]QEL17352.1 hypothetical protein PX52LOC_04335 [Limnoglobus roseus]
MYPSGPWKGFWHQDIHGRQPMEQFELHFATDGTITGRGVDMVGLFFFRGTCHTTTGQLTMTKQYVGKHAVEYVGRSDGEGRIVGTWSIYGITTGPFSLHPVLRGDEPIQEIVK